MTPTFPDLKGKTALITGASTGLGKHFASLFASQGMHVALAARRLELVAEAASEVASAGVRAIPLALDVTDRDSVARAVDAATSELGVIDVLVNNAGISINGPAIDQSESDWDRVMDTNLKGAFLMSSAVARRMRDAGKPGNIINIASVLAFRQTAFVAAYATSKSALVQLTKELALELARHEIRVNAIAPGYILTDLNRNYFATDAGARLIQRIPQKRLGDPKDLDGPMLLLASDASRFMTGTVLAVDGGYMVASV